MVEITKMVKRLWGMHSSPRTTMLNINWLKISLLKQIYGWKPLQKIIIMTNIISLSKIS